jgi:hypothetical protein
VAGLAQLALQRFLLTTGFRRLQESKVRQLGLTSLVTAVYVDALDPPGPLGKRALLERSELRRRWRSRGWIRRTTRRTWPVALWISAAFTPSRRARCAPTAASRSPEGGDSPGAWEGPRSLRRPRPGATHALGHHPVHLRAALRSAHHRAAMERVRRGHPPAGGRRADAEDDGAGPDDGAVLRLGGRPPAPRCMVGGASAVRTLLRWYLAQAH